MKWLYTNLFRAKRHTIGGAEKLRKEMRDVIEILQAESQCIKITKTYDVVRVAKNKIKYQLEFAGDIRQVKKIILKLPCIRNVVIYSNIKSFGRVMR